MRMKRTGFGVVFCTLLLAISGSERSFSAETAGKSRPCKTIVSACQGAGFYKGGHKQSKGLWRDCFNPILSGQSVPGVTVDPAEVQACQVRRSERKAKHG